MTDGQYAVEKVLQKPSHFFNMIILDIDMPRKDGLQACTEILEYFEHEKPRKGVQNISSIQRDIKLNPNKKAMRRKASE